MRCVSVSACIYDDDDDVDDDDDDDNEVYTYCRGTKTENRQKYIGIGYIGALKHFVSCRFERMWNQNGTGVSIIIIL